MFLVIWYPRSPRKFSWSPLLFPVAYTLYMDRPPSSMPPTQCTRSSLLLACLPRNLRGISAENTWDLLTSGTRCISCYLCSQCPTSAAAYTDVKWSLQVNIQPVGFSWVGGRFLHVYVVFFSFCSYSLISHPAFVLFCFLLFLFVSFFLFGFFIDVV